MDSNLPQNVEPYINGSGRVDRTQERDSWKDVAQNFYTDVSNLMARESELIRAEMDEKITQIKVATGAMVASGVVLFFGGMCLCATAILCLNLVVPLYLSALIVTAVLLCVGGIMFAGAKKKMNAADLKPVKSIGALSEIRTTLQEKVNEITKH